MRIYGTSVGAFDVMSKVKEHYDYRRDILARKMKQIPVWQKQLATLNDPNVNLKMEKLVASFHSICIKEGITFPVPQGYAYNASALYKKEDVTVEMYLSLDVKPDKLWANFYAKKNNALAFRIYIGKSTRITNNILQCLLKG